MKFYIDKKWKKEMQESKLSYKKIIDIFKFESGQTLIKTLLDPIAKITITLIYPLLFLYHLIVFDIIVTAFFIRVKEKQ